ncbi:MAG: MarR family transcriptional regulator [Lachnospiraceae bacterium]|nr:MarR family transcriptional regulator [Lachnospiraceae bacterium]
MNARNQINSVLVHLFNEIMKLEERAIITEEFSDISNNDMHVIEAVGIKGNNMTTIANKLNITVGSLTTAMNALVKKHYVERNRSEKDRRIVNITLTEKGLKAYHHHARFHDQLTDAVVEKLDEEQVKLLAATLGDLSDFFRRYEKNR